MLYIEVSKTISSVSGGELPAWEDYVDNKAEGLHGKQFCHAILRSLCLQGKVLISGAVSRHANWQMPGAKPGMTFLQAYKTYKLGGNISELLYSPATYGIDLSHKDVPRPSGSLYL